MMLQLNLKRVRQLCESTRELRFETSDGTNLDYEAGQFYRFSFEDNEGLFQRSKLMSFSVAGLLYHENLCFP